MKKKRKLAEKIVDFWVKVQVRKHKKSFSRQLEYEIIGLHPGVNSGKLLYDFYVNKVSLCLMILGAGFVFILLYVWSSWTNRNIERERFLERNPVGGVEKNVVLDAQVGDFTIKGIRIPIRERTLSKEESQALLQEVADMLAQRILGDNVTLEYVDKPLELISSWEDKPVSILWDSSNYELLQNDGNLSSDFIPEDGEKVILTATLTCEESILHKQIAVTLYPPVTTAEESIRRDLILQLEQNQEASITNEYMELPATLHEEPIIWTEPSGKLLPTLILLILGAVMAVFIGKDRDVHKEYEERNRRLLMEYPEFISKLQLLLCCGMSIRSAFLRIAGDYQKSRKKGGHKKYVCEELLLAVRKMENGMSEVEALEYFGARCHLFCYKKAVILILQNLKRGSDGLREALLDEVKNAFEQRKQTAKKLGEEAGTKLLLPMMMMMGVVLLIIVVPAYFSFGGI